MPINLTNEDLLAIVTCLKYLEQALDSFYIRGYSACFWLYGIQEVYKKF